MQKCYHTCNNLRQHSRRITEIRLQLTKRHPSEEETCGLHMSSPCRLLRQEFADMRPFRPGRAANHTMHTSTPAAPSVWISDLPCCLIHTRRADVHHCGSTVAIHGFHFPTCFQPGRLNACLVASSSLLPVSCMKAGCRAAAGQDPVHWQYRKFCMFWDNVKQPLNPGKACARDSQLKETYCKSTRP